ncbi:hypothetical protein Hanom_Chr04g00284491 [Helianthus anomalus]
MEISPWRSFNPLSSVSAKPPCPSMIILVRVCRLFNSPIPKGNFFRRGVSLMSKCLNFFSFEKLLGNWVKLLHPKTINVSKL